MIDQSNLEKAAILKSELDDLRPLSPEMEKRVMQKFRLDWNYHSSHIEGNQLTYGETKALLLFGHTAQAKPLKDHLEMTGHDEAIKYIEEVIKQERPLTENFIRELHQLILKERYQVDAITPDGKPSKRWVEIGKYKSAPNHVLTQTGEMFYFASPEETPGKMADLMDWYRENIDDPETNPILFAIEFHYRFIRIHPFDDGNGRLARLLMNFILMLKGFPPAIIRFEQKQDYLNALQQADAGQLDFFFNYVVSQVVRSLEIMIAGANGESIEEEDDIDKEIALWKNKAAQKEVKTAHRSDKVVAKIYQNGVRDLFEQLELKHRQFYDLFRKPSFKVFKNKGSQGGFEWIDKEMESILNVSEHGYRTVQMENGQEVPFDTFNSLSIAVNLVEFNHSEAAFSINSKVEVDFKPYYYSVIYPGARIQKQYGEYISEDESKKIIAECVKSTFNQIKNMSNIK